jgi:hypothetical protein
MIRNSDQEANENEDWWIDFFAHEMSPSVENFRVLKRWLVGSDPIGDWPLESRLRRVRRRVMEAIESDPADHRASGEKPATKSFKA